MPQRPGGESKSKKPGVYHRHKPREPEPLRWDFAWLPKSEDLTLFWTRDGRLWTDRECTVPTKWLIVEVVDPAMLDELEREN